MHEADLDRLVGLEVVYSLELDAGAGFLLFSEEPETNTTWRDMQTAARAVPRFLALWDNLDFAVDVDMRMWGKLETAYLILF